MINKPLRLKTRFKRHSRAFLAFVLITLAAVSQAACPCRYYDREETPCFKENANADWNDCLPSQFELKATVKTNFGTILGYLNTYSGPACPSADQAGVETFTT